jgi:dockerin type I repeat protein
MKKKSASRSAFFNPRVLIGLILCLAGITLAFFAFSKASAQQDPRNPQSPVQAQNRGLSQLVHFDISPPLRDIKPLPPGPCPLRDDEDRETGPHPARGLVRAADPVVQAIVGRRPLIPAPLTSFDGPSNLCGCSPPDPNGAVGPNHVLVISNLDFQIFNKSGTSLFGPAANNTLWSGFGGGCQTRNDGDPVVLYDQLADRWLISQFTAAAPYTQCIAVSQTSDPTGSYYRYSFLVGGGNNFGDYPKAAVWPDAYYFSTREFAGGSTFVGVGAYAVNRAQAISGNPPQVISFLAPPNPAYVVGDGLLPSNLDGITQPPTGSPNYYVGSEDPNAGRGAPQNALTLWKFHADFGNPMNSTFTLTNTIPTAPFNSILALCGGGRNCVPQPNTTNRIDHLGYRQRPTFRLAYRNFGDHESLVTNQSVSAGTGPNGEVSGIRWWELRSPNSSPVIFQEGTYAPGLTDGIHRWMGSIAMNSLGDIALGFSASNGTNPSTFPSVFYTARNANSPLGTMPLGEGSIINGTGSQTGSQRWGDYTSLWVDPTDDITFWYVNQYVPTTTSIGWRLRIGAFRLAPVAQSAFSRKMHGGAGTFDVPLPLTGNVGVECRSGGATNDYQMIVNFANAVTVESVAVTSGTGTVDSFSVSGSQVTVNLTGVTNVQRITVTLHNVNDGTSTGDVPVSMGVLVGDVNGNAVVNASDVSLTKSQVGNPVTSSNFREDVNANGTISATDVTLVKSEVGTALPP